MSTTPVVSKPNAVINTSKRYNIVTWTLTDGESGDIFTLCAGFNDKSVHVYGTIGGATVTMKGGNVNDATKFETLKDFDGETLVFSAAGLNSVRDHIAFMQPVVTGGSGSAIVVAVLME